MPGQIYQFGDFQLDSGRFELLRNGKSLRIERKPMELLILLVSCQGQLVTRAEIAQRLWSSEVFVDTEHGINTAIRKLRHLLRDDPVNPQFIQTVTGKGYRFLATVTSLQDSPEPAETPADEGVPAVATAPSPTRRRTIWYIAAGICALLAVIGARFYLPHHHPPDIAFTQLTDFTDSAVAPALSPDGRMVAFIRGSNGFLGSDQIYVKMLPDGEAKRVTDDSRAKYGLAFSPDGSQIAYTVFDAASFSTYIVSVLGGESQLLMKNAAGLTWLDQHQLLYSRIRPGSGIHLGVVTSSLTGTGLRDIYLPAHERGMAHYAYPSPDRRWALVVEMNENGGWGPCRLVSLDGQPARSAGPAGACTSAGWSPDGSWMYFTVATSGLSHLWGQHFPAGSPEQITFGPTEEDGVAVAPQGHSIITSLGVHESSIWLHDPAGERQLSSEGEVLRWLSPPSFSPDATILYYLLQRGQSGTGAELWRTTVESGKSEAVFPGISMIAYDVSSDGKQVVYATAAPDETTQLWIASVDRSSPAIKVGPAGGTRPHFGARGRIIFQKTEGDSNFLEQINQDGSSALKVLPYPILGVQSISPARHWMVVEVPNAPESHNPAVMAIPLDGGIPRPICLESYCIPSWSPNGSFLFIDVEEPSRTSPGRSLAIPLGPGETLPDLQPGGFEPLAEPGSVKGSQSVPRAFLVPGKDLEHYAYINTTVHKNLYRVSLP